MTSHAEIGGGRERRRAPGRGLPALLVVLLGLGCAGSARPGRTHPDLQVIDQADLVANHFLDAYEAVEALRSNWLNERPNSLLAASKSIVLVYYDNIRLGGVSELRGLRLEPVVYIRHFNALEATERWGVGHTQGVIYISTHPD